MSICSRSRTIVLQQPHRAGTSRRASWAAARASTTCRPTAETPDDYDDWVRQGASGWGWSDVLPFFKKAERDLDYDGPLHGKSGPLPIRRIQPEVWPGFAHAAAKAFEHAGFKALADQNAEFEDGFFPVAISNIFDRRVSTAIGYLDNAARRRKNLEIWANSTVVQLIIEGRRVTGVDVRTPLGSARVLARETIVSAGGIHSPAMLLRAGIGPGPDLQKLGIGVVAHRRGVGRNLQEHPTISISSHIKPPARLNCTNQRRHIHVALRYSSGTPDGMANDMYMVAMAKTGWHR